MGVSLGVFVVAGLMVLTVMFLMAMFASLYRRQVLTKRSLSMAFAEPASLKVVDR